MSHKAKLVVLSLGALIIIGAAAVIVATRLTGAGTAVVTSGGIERPNYLTTSLKARQVPAGAAVQGTMIFNLAAARQEYGLRSLTGYVSFSSPGRTLLQPQIINGPSQCSVMVGNSGVNCSFVEGDPELQSLGELRVDFSLPTGTIGTAGQYDITAASSVTAVPPFPQNFRRYDDSDLVTVK
jgi:hypothetical protein